jgi:Transcription factor WhiB
MPRLFVDASCVGVEWWPWSRTATDRAELWGRAVRVCEGCPCRAECATEALSYAEPPAGVWAGVRLSPSLGWRRVEELLGPLAVEGAGWRWRPRAGRMVRSA